MSFALPPPSQHENDFPAVYERRTPPPPTLVVISPIRSHVHAPPRVRSSVDDNAPNADILRPRPEKRMLGYISTSSLIINRMIGTGIFSKPSDILKKTGSKGGALLLWVVGGMMTLSGLLLYLELGIRYPENGGELVYLERCYPNLRYFFSTVFSIFFVLLCSNSANTIAFAKSMLMAFNGETSPDYRLQQFIALVTITFVCLLHFFSRDMGIFLSNALAAYKITLLLFVVVTGFVCLAGGGRKDGTPSGPGNLEGAFENPSQSPYSYASAMLSVLFAYEGWENANYVLAEVKRPGGNVAKTFKRAALFSFSLVTVLYVLANVAYLTGVGISVAVEFFKKVFGKSSSVTRGLRVLVAFSALGNVVANTYTTARVKREIAKRRILPFSKFWEREHPYYVFDIPAFDNDEAYNLTIFVSIGLAVLAVGQLEWNLIMVGRKTLYSLISFYILLNLFVIILMWWPPTEQVGIPSTAAPAVGTGVLGFGVLYWLVISKVMPTIGLVRQEIPVDEGAVHSSSSSVVAYKWSKSGLAERLSNWWTSKLKRAAS
ncbi:amino acid permease-domain-containing protein [Morchella snyderi]|nr:amino acid permease-domain-containing protein [Morchella snyderi]